jgi:glycosyltransferase involved in cell wall biosynthesis
MRLCIVTHNILKGDGQGRVNYEIVCEAIQRGHTVTLVATNVTPEFTQHPQVTWVYIPVKGYPTQLLRGAICAWRSGKWLRQNQHKFDIVQVHGANVTTASDVNVVHFVHSSWLRSPIHPSKQSNIEGLYQWLYSFFNTIQEKRAFARTKAIVAVSQKVKQELIEIDIPPTQIHTILNGVDIEEFYPGKVERSRFKLPLEVPMAAFVGDIKSNRKNLDAVMKAMVKVPQLHLAVVGETKGSSYPQMAAALNLASRVHFLGYRREVAEIMRAVDFFVFPSRYDPFGLVVTEAMASGLPAIVTSATGASELVTTDSGIAISDSEDIEALAQALERLASDRLLCQQMGTAARQIAEQHSWQSKARAYLDLFEDISSKQP